MKTRYLIAALTLGAALLSSCTEDKQEPNTKNKGKDKPAAVIEFKDNTDVEFTVTLNLSGDAVTYGYVVYAADSYEYKTIPSAYDIVTKGVTGTFVSDAVLAGDKTSADVNVKCILKDYYQICAASIDKNGLLSEVDTMTVHIPGAHPDIAFHEGIYTITPFKASDLPDGYAYPVFGGNPFEVTIAEVAPATYVMSAKWFGLVDIDFVGTYNFSDNTLSFDGTEYGYEQYGSDFGYIVGYLNSAHTLAYAINISDLSTEDPLVLGCTVKDKVATVSSIKSGNLELTIAQYNGGWGLAGLYGYFDSTSKIEFTSELPEE